MWKKIGNLWRWKSNFPYHYRGMGRLPAILQEMNKIAHERKRAPILLVINTLIFFLITAVALADEPQVSASLSQNEVLLGDSVILTIAVKGVSNPQTPQVPKIDGMEIKFSATRQESFSSFTVIIQGQKMEEKRSGGGYYFDFELVPQMTGIFTIPSLPISEKGRLFHTEQLQLKVLDTAQKSEDIFVEFTVDKKDVYLGEKILATFKWYFNKDIGNYRVNVPWLDGLKNFLITDPKIENDSRYQRFIINGDQQVAALKTREFYNGQAYTVISFQKILTPISVGKYSLEPVFVKCEVVAGYKKSSRRGSLFDEFFDSSIDDFFGLGREAVVENFATRSNALELTVNEVPQVDKPADFQGAVGEFNFTVDLKPSAVKVGEPITLSMKIFGSGNIEQLQLPDLPQIEGFKSYEPGTKVDMSEKNGEVVGIKTFEKVLVPKRAGYYEIPEIEFSFFNPRQKQYQTVKRGPFKVQVEKGEEIEDIKVVALPEENIDKDKDKEEKKEIKILKKDIRYIKPNLGKISGYGEQVYKKPAVWILGYLLPVFVMGIFAAGQKRRKKYQTDIKFARNKKALQNVKGFLKKAEKAMQQQNARDFYEALSKGLNGYLADKLNRQFASISSEIAGELKEYGLEEKKIEEFRRLYQTFDLVFFSSAKIEMKQLRKDFTAAKDLIVSLERILK